MADQAPKDAGTKARILNHMNVDHAASISYYLQHYARVPARAAAGAVLRDISFTSMAIQTRDGRQHDVAITPPMASWADARTRTVAMDLAARSALGLSAVMVQEYAAPRTAPQLLFIAGLLVCFASHVALVTGHLRPGSWAWDTVLQSFPGGPQRYFWVIRNIFWPIMGLHLVEAVYMAGWRLRRHGVVLGTGLWWMWVIGTFIEGYFSHDRFSKLARSKASEMEKRQH